MMYDYEWDRLRSWLNQYNALGENVLYPEDVIRIDLSGNSLKSIPKNIGMLSKLLVLNLSNNRLTSLPDSMKKLSTIRRMRI